MSTFLDRVETFQGDIMIITKTNYLFLFQRADTSLLPVKAEHFVL